MEQKQFNEGDKVLLKGNTENIYVVSKVIHNYRGNGVCRYHLRKENEEYGSFLRFVRGGKLSAYEEQQPKFKVGDWVRDNKGVVLKIDGITPFIYMTGADFLYYVKGCNISYIEGELEPYQPKEGEFYYNESAFGHKFITYSDKSKADLYNLNIETGYIECVWHLHTPTPTNIRPATEKEKQTLIKAVEEGFSKTYCEKTKEWVDMKEKSDVKADNVDRFRQIAEANKEIIELLVKVGVLQDPTNPSDVYSYNVGQSDYAKKSPIQPWMMWQLWHWLTP